jgi:hypothetical protein
MALFQDGGRADLPLLWQTHRASPAPHPARLRAKAGSCDLHSFGSSGAGVRLRTSCRKCLDSGLRRNDEQEPR